MIVYSPDGKYFFTASEGEPETDNYNDPVGSVSIIAVHKNYAVVTTDFSGFAGTAGG
ncbi:hypothetical protein [Pollutibacter soli]|uniref:hypothetical protein n=1 Tax=Pollutibacter soli TaxID=3034157 RepID=UPI003013DFB9